ncbi:hypothetical protein SY83_04105 [Paenibacillus swuensis]|uniref:Uncharacterized protein n=1 Tax=Paenibacillus swuensis TaxID=1178515 RepID=A0A172TEZ2_9BACL|nr:hypothetical protein SY83_04105 [Paenibacillus swuensis]
MNAQTLKYNISLTHIRLHTINVGIHLQQGEELIYAKFTRSVMKLYVIPKIWAKGGFNNRRSFEQK